MLVLNVYFFERFDFDKFKSLNYFQENRDDQIIKILSGADIHCSVSNKILKQLSGKDITGIIKRDRMSNYM